MTTNDMPRPGETIRDGSHEYVVRSIGGEPRLLVYARDRVGRWEVAIPRRYLGWDNLGGAWVVVAGQSMRPPLRWP